MGRNSTTDASIVECLISGSEWTIKSGDFVSLRGDIRDYVSGNPALNVELDEGLQHDVIPKGGIVFSF
jgi:hypothetical protein